MLVLSSGASKFQQKTKQFLVIKLKKKIKSEILFKNLENHFLLFRDRETVDRRSYEGMKIKIDEKNTFSDIPEKNEVFSKLKKSKNF